MAIVSFAIIWTAKWKDTLNVGTSGLYWTGTLAVIIPKQQLWRLMLQLFNCWLRYAILGCAIRPVFASICMVLKYLLMLRQMCLSQVLPSMLHLPEIIRTVSVRKSYSTESGVNPDNGTVITSATVGTRQSNLYYFRLQPIQHIIMWFYLVLQWNRISSQVQSFTTEKKFLLLMPWIWTQCEMG